MRKSIIPAVLLFLLDFAAGRLTGNQIESSSSRDELSAFFRKSDVTVSVTDSGLGGLSIMADAAARMKAAGIFRTARFIFTNALFSAQGGYNTLRTKEEKAARFDEVLESIDGRNKPDLILIACNTLSVIYDATTFSKRAGIPVIPIAPAATDLISSGLREHPESAVLIFGTPTTVSEGTYQKNLADAGFGSGRVFSQACPELEVFIERDCAGEETALLIDGFIEEALGMLPKPRPPLFVSLNCTHYGYSLPLWEQAFARAGIKPLAILNPNSRMSDILFPPELMNRYPRTEVQAEVASRVEIPKTTVDSLGAWLKKISLEVAEALRRYRYLLGADSGRNANSRIYFDDSMVTLRGPGASWCSMIWKE